MCSHNLGHGRRIALGIARGLAFLHSHCMMHADLRPRNVLLGRDLTAKLADVVRVHSKVVNHSRRSNQTAQGIPSWMVGCCPIAALVSLSAVCSLRCSGLQPLTTTQLSWKHRFFLNDVASLCWCP